MNRHVRFRGGVLLQTSPVKIRFYGNGRTTLDLSHAGFGNAEKQVTFDGDTADVALSVPGAWPGTPEPQPAGTVPQGTAPAMQPCVEVTFPDATAVLYLDGTYRYVEVIAASSSGLSWSSGTGRLVGATPAEIATYEYLDFAAADDPVGHPIKP